MAIYQHALDATGDIIFTNFPHELYYLFAQETEGTFTHDLSIGDKVHKCKIGFIRTECEKLFVLTTDSKYVNSSKLFKEVVTMSIFTMQSIVEHKNKISFDHNSYVQDLIHNLTSLNTYNIQDLFSLIPQHILTQNINKQHEIIKGILVEQPNVAVTTLLKLIKYNLAMKVEFSVFEKTVIQNPSFQKMDFPIREIILSVLQIFIEDFENSKIVVSLDATSKYLNVDYDTLFVSLYYILENSVKYCFKGSKYSIIFKEEVDCFSIIFKMISVKIEEHEKAKLCNKNFRARSAEALTSEGKGIGMYRILKTLKMNNADIEIFPRVSEYNRTANGIIFEHNEFKIRFIGQQDWFRT